MRAEGKVRRRRARGGRPLSGLEGGGGHPAPPPPIVPPRPPPRTVAPAVAASAAVARVAVRGAPRHVRLRPALRPPRAPTRLLCVGSQAGPCPWVCLRPPAVLAREASPEGAVMATWGPIFSEGLCVAGETEARGSLACA